ncbi:hypothetical protein [Clavibacter capsici]|uniref:hypothetical protein n=1 Tax=Clavibacter capsici TaxID=1874630 RepID=UPI001427F2D8|nr:hypothetical protein [Clavibacter capsici]QIS38650.1 hypothetical protein GW572_04555 [Clavibacter capsici]
MDLSLSIEPNSAQVNAEDLLAGPRTVTITGVEAGTVEQPVFVHLAEIADRTYRPSKSMRRVMVSGWGADASAYVGRRLTLYRDPDISFGRDVVGGIRISAMSDIAKPLSIALTISRGKRKTFAVAQLAPARDWLAELTTAGDNLDAVSALGSAAKAAGASADVLAAIRAEYTRLKEAAS